jgi:hypothetical protein
VIVLERSGHTQRNTQGWLQGRLEFHRSKRQWSDLDASVLDEPAPLPDSLCQVTIVPEYAQLVAIATQKTGGTAESVLVGRLSRYVLTRRTHGNDMSVRVMCGNRFLPQVQHSVAQLSSEVWMRIGAANSAKVRWHARIHGTDVREAVRVLRERPLSRAITPEAWVAPGFVKHEVELDCTVGIDRRTGNLVLGAQAPRWPEPWADSLVDWPVEELIRLIELD